MRFWLATLIFSKQLRSCFKVIFQLIPSIRLDAPVLWIKATSKSVFNSSTLASRNNSCLPCVRVCYQLFEFKDSFIDSFEVLFVLLFRYLFLISLRIVFSLKLHYFFTIFHYFIVFATLLFLQGIFPLILYLLYLMVLFAPKWWKWGHFLPPLWICC